MQDHILSVSALTRAVKGTLEGAFPFVWVRGQVTNLSRPSSGHLYFSLRDEESSLAAVWFKGAQKPGEGFDPLTGEVYEDGPRRSLAETLENGQEVVCAGRLTVYGPRGSYQMVVELAQDAGQGRLHEEFERLKNRLAGLGYFATERKRPLPVNPARVAVITAKTGAAVYDFCRVAEGRGFGSEVRIHPAQVQGEAAPPAILERMAQIAGEGWAEVLVLIRGGGSLEDLWAFNDERLASAVFNFPVPVLAGIGHEVDFTLADLTADVRAATPSHAAQLLWTDREELKLRAAGASAALLRAKDRYFERQAERLFRLAPALQRLSPERQVQVKSERLNAELRFLSGAVNRILENKATALASVERSVAAVPQRLPAAEVRLSVLAARFAQAGRSAVDRKVNDFERGLLRLQSVDPHAPLERGYALVRKEDGGFVRGVGSVSPRELLHVIVRDGVIPVRVEGDS